MNTDTTFTSTFGNSAAEALPVERAAFIRKTYVHLGIALAAFAGLEAYLLTLDQARSLAVTMSGGYNWLIVLMLFMGVSVLAQKWAMSEASRPLQYMGLLLFIVAEAILFLPLFFYAATYSGPDVFIKAGVVTLGLFLGLTAVVLMTRKDFSFLGPILMVGFFIALAFIASSLIFGFSLGNVFAFAMVAFAGGSILYETSNMLHHYRTDQYVAASLGLFASVALLFWYILRIFVSRD